MFIFCIILDDIFSKKACKYHIILCKTRRLSILFHLFFHFFLFAYSLSSINLFIQYLLFIYLLSFICFFYYPVFVYLLSYICLPMIFYLFIHNLLLVYPILSTDYSILSSSHLFLAWFVISEILSFNILVSNYN